MTTTAATKKTAATRKAAPTRRRPAAAKKPDVVLKTSAGAVALNRTISAGDLFDLAEAELEDGMESLRIISRIFKRACHDEDSYERIRLLGYEELQGTVAELMAGSTTEDGAPAGESSGS